MNSVLGRLLGRSTDVSAQKHIQFLSMHLRLFSGALPGQGISGAFFIRGSHVSRVVEARRNKRKTFEYVAMIDFRDGEEPRPCELRDISSGGARLAVFTGAAAIPDKFILLLSASAKVRRNCKVCWRTETEVGVEFVKRLD